MKRQLIKICNLLVLITLGSALQSINAQPNVRHGKMTDGRDGQVYPTIMVNGLTWMAKNLNYRAYGSIDARGLGRLYAAAAARTACPPGWRLPSDSEWSNLALAFGGYGIVSPSVKRYGFNPAQAFRDLYYGGRSGFNAVSAGEMSQGRLQGFGVRGHYWSSSTGRPAIYYRFIPSYSTIFRVPTTNTKNLALSCRCVRKPISRSGNSYNQSRSRPTTGGLVTYITPCRTCKIARVTLYGPNGFRMVGRKFRNGNTLYFQFPALRPGNYNIEVKGAIGRSSNPYVNSGKADIDWARLRYSPRTVTIRPGQVQRVTLRRY